MRRADLAVSGPIGTALMDTASGRGHLPRLPNPHNRQYFLLQDQGWFPTRPKTAAAGAKCPAV